MSLSIDNQPAAHRHRLCIEGTYQPTGRGQRFIDQAIEILATLPYSPVSCRAIHYQRVSRYGAPNTNSEYTALCKYTADARWAGLIDMDAIFDETRSIDLDFDGYCDPFIDSGFCTEAVPPSWFRGRIEPRAEKLNRYFDDEVDISRWWNPHTDRNEPPLVLIEKSAMLPAFRDWCRNRSVALAALRGRPSVSMLWHLTAHPWRVIWLITDRDKTGDEIADDTAEHLKIGYERRVEASCHIERLGLFPEQAEALDLVPVIGKATNDYEMDAVPQDVLLGWLTEALRPYSAEAADARAGWSTEQQLALEEALTEEEEIDEDTLALIEHIQRAERCGTCGAPTLAA